MPLAQLRLESLQHETVAVRQRLRIDPLEIPVVRILEIHDHPVTSLIQDDKVHGTDTQKSIRPTLQALSVLVSASLPPLSWEADPSQYSVHHLDAEVADRTHSSVGLVEFWMPMNSLPSNGARAWTPY